jgi:hypothetical protein
MTWNRIKEEYDSYLRFIGLKQPERRINALHRVEEYVKTTHPSVYSGHALFTAINKDDLKHKFQNWKGRNISGAESQVINDFYKLSNIA